MAEGRPLHREDLYSHPPAHSGNPAAAPPPLDRGSEPTSSPSRYPAAQNEREAVSAPGDLFPLLALSHLEMPRSVNLEGSSHRYRAPVGARPQAGGVTAVGGWLRSRSAACGRCSEAEQGQRSAFCKRATSRAAKAGHRNPDWVKIIPRLRSKPPGTVSAVRRSSYTEVCGAPKTSRGSIQRPQV